MIVILSKLEFVRRYRYLRAGGYMPTKLQQTLHQQSYEALNPCRSFEEAARAASVLNTAVRAVGNLIGGIDG